MKANTQNVTTETLIADKELIDIYGDLALAKRQAKELKARIEELEARAKDKIGDSTEVIDGNTSELMFTWKYQTQSKFDSKSFKEDHPKYYKQYTSESEIRKFLVK